MQERLFPEPHVGRCRKSPHPRPLPSDGEREKSTGCRLKVPRPVRNKGKLSMNHTAAGVRANDAAAGLRHSRGPWFMVPMHARMRTETLHEP